MRGSFCYCYKIGQFAFFRLMELGQVFGNYSHSLRLNTFCIINVCLIPSGDSDSLWYSYSPAYTAFGYQNVITMITRGLIAVENEWFPHIHYTLRCACFQYIIGSFIGSYRLMKVDPISDT